MWNSVAVPDGCNCSAATPATRASGGGSSTSTTSQLGDSLGGAFHFDQHTGAVVQHIADEAERHGVAVDEWPEADALHGPGDS